MPPRTRLGDLALMSGRHRKFASGIPIFFYFRTDFGGHFKDHFWGPIWKLGGLFKDHFRDPILGPVLRSLLKFD